MVLGNTSGTIFLSIHFYFCIKFSNFVPYSNMTSNNSVHNLLTKKFYIRK